MPAAVILNPRAGRHGHRPQSAAARLARARRAAGDLGAGVEFVCTRSAGDGATLARSFLDRGFDRVIAWGGDGTVNEVSAPLIGSGATFGVIAAGSGDGFAGSAGLPRTFDAALRVAVTAAPRPIDIGWLGGRHFLSTGGIGFDAYAGARFNRGHRRGIVGYLTTVLPALVRYRADMYRIDLDGRTLSGPRFLIAFANGRHYGNRLILDAHADFFDGKLNAVIVDAGSAWTQLWRGRRLFFRPRSPAPGIERVAIERAAVTGDRLMCHVDGETFEARAAVDVRVQRQALLVAGVGP
jgi:diacylglycerol kinase family enzyme